MRVAIVTGAARGIGLAVARRLAVRGESVALLDVDEAALETAALALRSEREGLSVMVCCADVTRSADVARAVATVERELGAATILVNSVGGSTPAKPIDALTDEEWTRSLGLNLNSAFHCTRAVVPGMKARRWGRIVNVASVAGRTRSLFGGCDYTSAKAAVVGLTRQCAYELAPFGITVNVVAPGLTLSERVAERWASMPQEQQAHILSLIPTQRAGHVDEVAATIAFFCSEDASYSSGAIIDVNGGLFIP